MTADVTSCLKKVKETCSKCRGSRKLILVIVFIAIFLDNMLLTTVVPIIPNFILKLEESAEKPIILNGEQSIGSTRCFTSMIEVQQSLDTNVTDFIWVGDEYPPKVFDYQGKLCYNVTIENATEVTTLSIEEIKEKKQEEEYREYGDANVKAGILFGSKALVQMAFNPFVGPVTNRIGYTIPMFTGFVVMMISTVIFAFGESYAVLFGARALQGIGSSCSSVAGMGMLAVRYPDDEERGKAMGIALGGLALGVLAFYFIPKLILIWVSARKLRNTVGPPFGGIMYQFAGKEAPFLILAGLALFDGALQMFVLQPSLSPESQEGTSYLKLLKDPYILLAAGSITFANMGIAMMEPSLPIWMRKVMGVDEWVQGIAFLPASISYLLGTNIFGPIASKIGRWLSTMIGVGVISICLLCIPFCRNVGLLIVPMFGLGFAIGMVDSSMMPHLGYLVDLRHVSVYGNVYAIGDIAFALGFAVGPMLSGTIVKAIGFHWMLWIIAIVCAVYCPLLIFLRNPPGKEEKMSLILHDQCPVQYVTYNQTTHSEPVSDDDDGYYK